MKYRVGTRGSKLSRMQTEKFLAELQAAYPEDEFELQFINTLGDPRTHQTPRHHRHREFLSRKLTKLC
jgi:porphobilinogen deaminase